MIVGLGMDLVHVDRVRHIYGRFGERFLSRVFTQEEVAYCMRKRDSVPSLAARFAAKEAAMKALGTGASRDVYFRDVEVTRRKGEAPEIRFLEGAERRAATLGVTRALVTLTHEQGTAAAVVILERD